MWHQLNAVFEQVRQDELWKNEICDNLVPADNKQIQGEKIELVENISFLAHEIRNNMDNDICKKEQKSWDCGINLKAISHFAWRERHSISVCCQFW